MESTVAHQVRQLYEVERLSLRQIAKKLHVSRKLVSRIIQGQSLKQPPRQRLCQPYDRLIREWYQEYPFLKVTQAYERLKSYGCSGGYGTVKRYTRPLRQRKPHGFHELEFLPGEEAQIDWMEMTPPLGGALAKKDLGADPLQHSPRRASGRAAPLATGPKSHRLQPEH